MHNLATTINTKIYEQDDKLDEVSKEMRGQVDDIKASNDELMKARIITEKRNKGICMWTVLAFTLTLILGASIYFMFIK